jgi:hypothetical protein
MSDQSSETNLTRHLPDDLRNSEVVRALVSDPLPTVAAMITAALGSGHAQMVLAGGRVAQAVLKGRALKQVAREIDELLKKGKIRGDYADTKYGFRTLVELLSAIEEDASDEERLYAAKAMFVAVNAPHTPGGEALVRYQLFRTALKLSGSQLLLLAICFKHRRHFDANASTVRSADNWINIVCNDLGHRVTSLIEQDEAILIQLKILTPRFGENQVEIKGENARLTDLGLRLSELIESYSGDIPKSDSQKP